MIQFSILGQNIQFPEQADRYHKISLKCAAAREAAIKEFSAFYQECGQIRSVLTKYDDKITELIQSFAIEPLYKELLHLKIYDVTQEGFTKKCLDLSPSGPYYDSVAEVYDDIEQALSDAKEYRSMRKEGRGRWVGGGFGVQGAIKGATTAGAMNAITGLGHSFFNAIGNMRSESAANRQRKDLYENEAAKRNLESGLGVCIAEAFSEYIQLVNSRLSTADDYYIDGSCFDSEKATALFENAKKFPEERKNLLVQSLQHCPYDKTVLAFVFENYPQQQQNIFKIASAFSTDLNDCYEKIICRHYSPNKHKTKEQILDAKAAVITQMKAFNVKSSPTLTRVDNAYLSLIFNNDYRHALPGERDEAIKQIDEFNTSKAIKAKFIENNSIWELIRNYRITLRDDDKCKILYDEYHLLWKARADQHKITTFLDRILQAFEYDKAMDSELKQTLFRLLSDVGVTEKVNKAKALNSTLDLMDDVYQMVESTVEAKGYASCTTSLTYRRDQLLEAEKKLKYISLGKAEHALLIYESSPFSNPYASGFVLTNNRFVVKPDNKDVTEFPLENIPHFFVDGTIFVTLSIKCGKVYSSIKLENLSVTKSIDSFLSDVCRKLCELTAAIQKQTEASDQQAKVELLNCMQKQPALATYFGMQEQIVVFAKEQFQQQQSTCLSRIMDRCDKNNAESICSTWKEIQSSDCEEELRTNHLLQLYDYLCYLVDNAKKSSQIISIMQACEQLLASHPDSRLETLLTTCDEKKLQLLEAEALDLQTKRLANIMNRCDKSNAESICNAWVETMRFYCRKDLQTNQITLLCEQLSQLIACADKSQQMADFESACSQLMADYADTRLETLLVASREKKQALLMSEELQRQQSVLTNYTKKMDKKSMDSLVQTAKNILSGEFDAQISNEHIQTVINSVVKLIDSTSDLSTLHTMHQSLSTAMVSWLEPSTATLADKIDAIDKEQRTYKGILFASHADIEAARAEELRLEIIMRSVSQEDESSIRQAIAQVQESPSLIKKLYLDQLNNYLDVNDLQMRTYKGVVYETAQLASLAQEQYVEARAKMSELDTGNEILMQSLYDEFVSMNNVHLQGFIDQLAQHLQTIDLQLRTVDGILFETREDANLGRKEQQIANQIISSLNPDDEGILLQAKSQLSALTTMIKEAPLDKVEHMLTAYDLKMRTYQGKEYATRAQVNELKQEEITIGKIMSVVNSFDEESMLHARDRLLQLNTFLKDAPLHTISEQLAAYDIRIRTVQGILYNTREEAVLVSTELQQAVAIMEQVNPDDETSILQAQQEVLKFTSHVKDQQYNALQKLWEAYDLKQRTYNNIIFDSRVQAVRAKETREGFISLLWSLDLSQRSSVMTLRNYVEDTLHEKIHPEANEIINHLANTLDSIDYVVTADSRIDPAIHKKESAELHKYIETLMPTMKTFNMDTTRIEQIKARHYEGLNVARKLFSFLRNKGKS